MNIKEARDLFRSISGKRSMLDETVDIYFQAGLVFLDDLADTAHSRGRHIEMLTTGAFAYTLNFPIRVIESVSLTDVNGKIKTLKRVNRDVLVAYVGENISGVASGLPDYFALSSRRRLPISSDLTWLDHTQDIEESGSDADVTGILFDKPIDQIYQIDISGQFFGEITDNWWLVHYPLTVVHAAICKLEVGYRNTEGMKDWLTSIKLDIDEITKNTIEQESFDITKMEG